MAQVFGNRILGGIGAPESRAAEAFGAGVNTSITNRVNRQAMDVNAQNMAIQRQEMAWKEEDRKIAAQQRAAAAAAAAAAKAANKAALAGIATAQPFFRFGAQPAAPGATAPASTGATVPTAGVRLPRSMGTVVPAAPTAAARPAGGTVSGGAGSTTVAGGAGNDRLGVTPAPRDRQPVDTVRAPAANKPPSYWTPGVAVGRPGDFAAQATQARVADFRSGTTTQADKFELITLPAGDGPAGSFLYNRATGAVKNADGTQITLPGYAETVSAKARQYASSPEGDKVQQLTAVADALTARAAELAGQGYTTQAQELSQSALAYRNEAAQLTRERGGVTPTAQLMDRGLYAVEGPESSDPNMRLTQDAARATEFFTPTQTVTIMGPNGPMTMDVGAMGGDAMRFPPAGARPQPPAAPPPVTEIPTRQETLGFGLGSVTDGTKERTTFGPALGAAPTPTAMFLADLGRTPTGSVDLSALVAQQNSPVFDPNFSAAAEQERAIYAYAAQVAMNNGDINGYMSAVGKMREMETMILTQQLMVGVQEAVNFNSAQRLSEVASMAYGGADVVIIPKGSGFGDVYMNGRLAQSNVNIAAMGDQLLRMIDSDYRAQAAATEAERAKKVFETDEAIRQQTTIDQNKATLESEQKAVDMAFAIEQDLGVKMNELQVKQIEAALVASGKLPGPAAEYTYTKLGEDTIVVSSNGQKVATFQLQMQDTPTGPQPVVVETRG